MKAKTLLALALCASVPALACAKKPKKAEVAPAEEPKKVVVEEELGPPSEECLTNLSLFSENVKNKQFEQAYEPWWEVYSTCPNANKAIYSQGSKILEWKYNNAQTPEEKDRIRHLMIELHDKRIKYFGNDTKYPAVYVLGQKACDYAEYFPEDELKEEAYQWAKASIEGMGNKSQVQVLVLFADLSLGLYKSNREKYAEQYIADYQTATTYLGEIALDESNKNAAAAAQKKDIIEQLFAQSGAADCETLDQQYQNYVAANVNDLDALNKIIRLYKRVRCTESEVYFAASAAAHKLSPSEESAAGCARMATKKGEYKKAIEYYEQAVRLAAEEDDDEDRTDDYLFSIAMINYMNLRNYPQARAYAQRSLSVNKNQGRCYILIGLCYAASSPYSAPEYPEKKAAILNKTVFWAAVDKFQQAKRVDPSCASDADAQIRKYSQFFPTKEDIFDLPGELGGSTFTVGGWIQESTVCRPK